jgi:hypothetical protein
LSSDDISEKAHDERLEGAVGERGATMSLKWKSSKEKLANGVNGGE